MINKIFLLFIFYNINLFSFVSFDLYELINVRSILSLCYSSVYGIKNSIDKRLKYQLLKSCEKNSYFKTKILINFFCDVNCFVENDKRPLDIACKFARYNIVKLLLKNGSYINNNSFNNIFVGYYVNDQLEDRSKILKLLLNNIDDLGIYISDFNFVLTEAVNCLKDSQIEIFELLFQKLDSIYIKDNIDKVFSIVLYRNNQYLIKEFFLSKDVRINLIDYGKLFNYFYKDKDIHFDGQEYFFELMIFLRLLDEYFIKSNLNNSNLISLFKFNSMFDNNNIKKVESIIKDFEDIFDIIIDYSNNKDEYKSNKIANFLNFLSNIKYDYLRFKIIYKIIVILIDKKGVNCFINILLNSNNCKLINNINCINCYLNILNKKFLDLSYNIFVFLDIEDIYK